MHVKSYNIDAMYLNMWVCMKEFFYQVFVLPGDILLRILEHVAFNVVF